MPPPGHFGHFTWGGYKKGPLSWDDLAASSLPHSRLPRAQLLLYAASSHSLTLLPAPASSPSPRSPDHRRRPRAHTGGAPPLPPIRPDPRHTASRTRSQPSAVARVSGWASPSSPEWLRWTPATPLHLLPRPNERFGFPLATGCSLVGCIGLGLLCFR